MAEAYLKSKKLPGVEISSSGITALVEEVPGLSKYAERVLSDAGLKAYASERRFVTTREELETADIVIFMAQKHFDYTRDVLGYIPKRYEIWKVGDIPEDFWWWLIPVRKKKLADDRDIYRSIILHVDKLIKKEIGL